MKLLRIFSGILPAMFSCFVYLHVHCICYFVNVDKTELIVITKKIKNTTGGSIKVGGKVIESKKSVKFLGIMIDSHLIFQEVKKILKKMACRIKTIAAIQKPFYIQTRLLLLQSLVFSHLHYSSVLLSGISQKLIL